MDVQVIHALAPEAKIIVLQSPVAETEGIVGLPEYPSTATICHRPPTGFHRLSELGGI